MSPEKQVKEDSPYENVNLRETAISRASSKPSQRSWKSDNFKKPAENLQNIINSAARDA